MHRGNNQQFIPIIPEATPFWGSDRLERDWNWNLKTSFRSNGKASSVVSVDDALGFHREKQIGSKPAGFIRVLNRRGAESSQKP
jgi:hypothetical protein